MSEAAGDTSAALPRRAFGDQGADHAPVESMYGTVCRTCVAWQDDEGTTEFGIAIPVTWPCPAGERIDRLEHALKEAAAEMDRRYEMGEAAAQTRIAELEAALAGVIPRFVKTPDGFQARISGTDLDRLRAVADGRPADGQ